MVVGDCSAGAELLARDLTYVDIDRCQSSLRNSTLDNFLRGVNDS